MRLLLDECLPRRTKFMLMDHGHECVTVREAGFGSKENGELIALAERSFDCFGYHRQNIRYQQNIRGRKTAILIIRARSNDISDIERCIPNVIATLRSIRSGQIIDV